LFVTLYRFIEEDPMKKLMWAVVVVMCLAGFSSPSFADEMGKGKGEMKGEMKGEKGKTGEKGDKGKMQGEGGTMKSDMDKGDKDKMKGGK
jgi:hypothetical protein